MPNSPRYTEHPWREFAGVTENHCRKCGKPVYGSIQLCDACKRRFNAWISDGAELRFIETRSLDMGSVPTIKSPRAIYA